MAGGFQRAKDVFQNFEALGLSFNTGVDKDEGLPKDFLMSGNPQIDLGGLLKFYSLYTKAEKIMELVNMAIVRMSVSVGKS